MEDVKKSMRITSEVDKLAERCLTNNVLGATYSELMRNSICLTALLSGVASKEEIPAECYHRIVKILPQTAETDTCKNSSDSDAVVVQKLSELTKNLSGALSEISDLQNCYTEKFFRSKERKNDDVR